MSKKTDMWMPIVIGDYLRDTQRLTTEQHGAYLLLLMDYWTNGPMPADDAVLCSISRLKPARFRKHKSVLLSFFSIVDGELHHKRADAEKTRAIQNATRNSERAKHAAEVRWHGSNDDAPSNAPSNARGYAPECPSPLPSVTNVTAASPPSDTASVFGKGVPLLVSAGWTDERSRRFLGKARQEIGDAKVSDLIGQAAGKSDPGAWLRKAINNCPKGNLLDAAAEFAARAKAQAA
jgi:uncharacterized protein YdaU (DUF1376 family)